MEYLKIRDSVLNCSICCHSGVRRHTFFSKHCIQDFNGKMHHWQQNYLPVPSRLPNPNPNSYSNSNSSNEKLIKNRTMQQKYKSHRDGYEQIYRKSLITGTGLKKATNKSITKMKKTHNGRPAIVYQVYTLTTDDNNNIPKKRKSSKTVYSYPYSSSSSSDMSTSFIDKNDKKSFSMRPSYDEDDSDSEFNTCNKFPITKKHYRHIVDGIECSSSQNKPSASRKKPKEEKHKKTKRADEDFNQTNFFNQKQSISSNTPASALQLRLKKKCICKGQCKHGVEVEIEKKKIEKIEETDERSDSELSEKTFTKFINSLHSYVNKTKKYSHKHQRKRLDKDSSCSLCKHEEKHNIKIKKYGKEQEVKKHNHHHHNQNHQHHHHKNHHQSTQYKTDPKDILKKYLHE